MKAVLVNADRTLTVGEIEKPSLDKINNILVKVNYSGLCGSDIPRVFDKGAHFYPIVLGHEFSGVVEAVDDNVTKFKAGDKVCCVPLKPCFDCPECNKGLYSLCKNYNFIGSRRQGGNAEYIAMPEATVYKLPDYVNLKQGSFFEPITVSLHAMLLCGGCQDKNIILLGVGTIGLLALQAAKAMGAKKVIAIDLNDERLTLAKELGADIVINSGKNTPEDIYNLLADDRFDQLILETAGVPQTVKLALKIAGPRAQISLIGTLHKDLELTHAEFGQILRKELEIKGSWMNYSGPYPGKEWDLAAEFFGNGQIEIEPLIQHCGNINSYSDEVVSLNGKPMNGKILLSFEEK